MCWHRPHKIGAACAREREAEKCEERKRKWEEERAKVEEKQLVMMGVSDYI
jgi:hypothetical protein